MSGLVHWTLVSPWPSSHGDTFVRWIGVAASGLDERACRPSAFISSAASSLWSTKRCLLPAPGHGEVLLRVKAAGVGPWDAWIRSGRSVVSQPLPLTLGSDVAGIVESVGQGWRSSKPGDAVFGATNERFTGGYAEYAVASATKLARNATANGLHRSGVGTGRRMHRMADGRSSTERWTPPSVSSCMAPPETSVPTRCSWPNG